MHNENLHHGLEGLSDSILLVTFILLLILYVLAASISNRDFKRWSLSRMSFWFLGVFCLTMGGVGPIAHLAHKDFTAHMLGHLLVGMLAPLFIVLSAPMTLVLRILPVKTARRLSRFLRSWPLGLLTDPFFTSLLNVGGLWFLYTTGFYSLMYQSILLHIFIHLHIFISGYLFTASIIYIDPTSHRRSFMYRAIACLIALSGHEVLSKYIYIHPPVGVATAEAEMGGMLMYYGGDVIDVILIFILCLQWYNASKSKGRVNQPVNASSGLSTD
ncbi:putative membrane protein [Pullulanibacillus pueri]|uniref:Membrane protein n=1 Tax=Pullulanibacillus pueri TaxID=1437324 RepID=A0A8J2ZZS0_9BACL|nr:cytochrome c oxidase assembly protein [Pullulanibacillus pueri]MBM7684178.1 putative membrane protein [Pullulanibacillus pueri]GGH88808.1 membrane protein [Pullulanibacillus pueri]